MGRGSGGGRSGGGGGGSAKSAADLPLDQFAGRAVGGALASPGGGFGEEKTFISHAHAHLQATDPAFRAVTLDQFKARLLEANRARHLDLGRADLIPSVSFRDVQKSEITHFGVAYHFIRHAPAPGKKQSLP